VDLGDMEMTKSWRGRTSWACPAYEERPTIVSSQPRRTSSQDECYIAKSTHASALEPLHPKPPYRPSIPTFPTQSYPHDVPPCYPHIPSHTSIVQVC
jgi:hypothetical protein